MKCATYLRVSTDSQSIEPQRIELNRYIAERSWTHVAEHADVMSGAKITRIGLERLMAALRTGEYEAVLVVKIDRLARSIGHFAVLVDEFLKRGVALIVPGQGIDTSNANPAGKLQMHVLAAVAEFERSIISERTKAGLVCARAKGHFLGRPSKNLVKNWPEVVARWKRRVDPSYSELARELGGVAKSTAWRLANQRRTPADVPPQPPQPNSAG